MTAAAAPLRSPARMAALLALGEAPALGLDGRDHGADDGLPLRRRFNTRWLTATGLMGAVAAALMCGALLAAVQRDSRRVSLPIAAWRVAVRNPAIDKPRSDRLHPAVARAARADLKHEVRVEQLAPSGKGMRPFTHVAARLADVVAAVPPGRAPAERAPADTAPDDGDDGPGPSARAARPMAMAAALKAVQAQMSQARGAADLAAVHMAGQAPSPSANASGSRGAAALPAIFGPPPAPGPATLAYAAAAPALPSGMPPEILQGGSHGPQAAGGIASGATSDIFEDDTSAIGEPVNVSVLKKGAAQPAFAPPRVLVAKRGDTLEAILAGAGLAAADVAAIARTVLTTAGVGTFNGGEEVVLEEPAADGRPQTARPLRVRVQRDGTPVAALALTDGGAYVPVAVPPLARSELASATDGEGVDASLFDGVSVRDGLYRLADAKLMDEGLIDALVRLAERDVDLDAPLTATDQVELVYGQPDDAGTEKGADSAPEIAFVALGVDGKTHRYYRFVTPDDGAPDYYDDAGKAVTKLLLRKPFANGRLGDGFGWRVHPILGDRRFHNGVDYVGPAGSPIVAAGSGVVEKIDYQTGYGKYIRLQHDGGYETTYAHVAGYPSSIRVGQRVRQGQVIAYVGSTGYSTGPHLYYELKINGHYADPTRVKLPGGRVLQGEMLAAFQRERGRMDALAAATPAAPVTAAR